MSEPFANVTGGDLHQTERDYDREVSNADIRAKQASRLRERLTKDGPDATAVLFRCGCVAGVKDTEADAKAWLAWNLHDNHATDPAKWEGATLVAVYAVFVDGLLTVYRRDDDSLIPDPSHDTSRHCDVHGWSEARWAAWRQTRRDLGLEVDA